jgi:hypothetical protein
MADQPHTSDDGQFGKMAQEKQDQADALDAKGVDPTEEPEGEGQDPRPRAASKASDGARPATEK